MPKVSVIVPVYGVEKYIERCARSLFEQTLDDIELIFVDDCTPDKSIEILKNVLEEYPHRKNQVIIHRMEKNSGQAAVRKWGMLNATGDYVIHCDSDDWVDVTMYEKMYNKAIEEGSDVVVCDFYRTDNKSYRYRSITVPKDIYKDKMLIISKMLIGSDLTSLCTKIVCKDICNKIVFPKYNMQEDAYLSLQIFFLSQRVSHVSEALYYYFNNPISISKHPSVESYLKRLHEVCENTNGMIAFAKDNGIYENLKEAFDCQKLRARNHIVPLTREKIYYKLWKNTYHEIDNTILQNSIIDKKELMQYIFIKIKLYHFLHKVFSIIKKVSI